jgi:hypothetical protein
VAKKKGGLRETSPFTEDSDHTLCTKINEVYDVPAIMIEKVREMTREKILVPFLVNVGAAERLRKHMSEKLLRGQVIS